MSKIPRRQHVEVWFDVVFYGFWFRLSSIILQFSMVFLHRWKPPYWGGNLPLDFTRWCRHYFWQSSVNPNNFLLIYGCMGNLEFLVTWPLRLWWFEIAQILFFLWQWPMSFNNLSPLRESWYTPIRFCSVARELKEIRGGRKELNPKQVKIPLNPLMEGINRTS